MYKSQAHAASRVQFVRLIQGMLSSEWCAEKDVTEPQGLCTKQCRMHWQLLSSIKHKENVRRLDKIFWFTSQILNLSTSSRAWPLRWKIIGSIIMNSTRECTSSARQPHDLCLTNAGLHSPLAKCVINILRACCKSCSLSAIGCAKDFTRLTNIFLSVKCLQTCPH